MFPYNTNTPILFLIFNRPDTTRQVFSQIRKAKPQWLYIAADGPRSSEEKQVCEQVREIATTVDWNCNVQTLFRDENLGCGRAIGQAITWFFENEPEGIILEDDCLPADSFFGFCSAMLERYRDDNRIGHISGGNYQKGIARGDGSYYFSALTNIWGWAGWRRIWKDYDANIGSLPLFEKFDYIRKMPSHGPFKDYWIHRFRLYFSGKKSSWDFQYSYLNLINNRLSVISNANMISNIGCAEKATHNIYNHPFANLPLEEKYDIVHPSFVIADTAADLYAQSLELNVPVPSPLYGDDYMFLKDRLLNINQKKGNFIQIPRIIHQIYEDPAGPPEHLLDLSKTWKEKHPQWEYRFWNKQAIEDFLQSVFPDLIPHYRSFPFDVQRWDAIRYLILYHFGGLYTDMDYECLEPLDTLLSGSSCCMGMEPAANAVQYYKNMIVGNALMASAPGHQYFKLIIDEMINNKIQMPHKTLQVMETTGPFMVTRLYKAYTQKEEITLLPAELITPLTLEEVQKMFNGQETQEIEDKVEKAFAIHYFLGSWVPQTK